MYPGPSCFPLFFSEMLRLDVYARVSCCRRLVVACVAVFLRLSCPRFVSDHMLSQCFLRFLPSVRYPVSSVFPLSYRILWPCLPSVLWRVRRVCHLCVLAVSFTQDALPCRVNNIRLGEGRSSWEMIRMCRELHRVIVMVGWLALCTIIMVIIFINNNNDSINNSNYPVTYPTHSDHLPR